jgi:hypothetical protein
MSGDLITLTAINSKFKKCQKNAARNFDSGTLFNDHGKKSDSTRMSKCAFNHLYGWDPRLRLRRPTRD